jgi:putative Holliday junction resolvase
MTTLLSIAQTTVAALPAGSRLMGLDLGTKTIGIATADRTRQIATPRETIARTKFSKDIARMLEIGAEENIGLYVMGLPLNMDGSEGPRAQSTRSFHRNFTQQTGKVMIFWDERLSTAAVQRAMIEADVSRAKRGRVVDQLAAAYILQSFLDAVCT